MLSLTLYKIHPFSVYDGDQHRHNTRAEINAEIMHSDNGQHMSGPRTVNIIGA